MHQSQFGILFHWRSKNVELSEHSENIWKHTCTTTPTKVTEWAVTPLLPPPPPCPRMGNPHTSVVAISCMYLLTCLLTNNVKVTSISIVILLYSMAELSHYISEVGRPYQWVQTMCGLQFLDSTSDHSQRALCVSASHIEMTIKRLRSRIRSRLALQHQLSNYG